MDQVIEKINQWTILSISLENTVIWLTKYDNLKRKHFPPPSSENMNLLKEKTRHKYMQNLKK